MSIARDISSAAQLKDQPVRRSAGLDKLFLVLVILYLIIPLGATLVFGLSGGKGVDLHTYQQIVNDSNFWQTITLSLELATAATILAIVLVTPTAYWVQLRLPRARPLMDFLSLAPFAVPAIVLSLGLVEEYGSSNTLINVLSRLSSVVKQPSFQHRQYATIAGLRLCDCLLAVCV